MKICKTHTGKEFKLKDGQYGPFYSHVTGGDKEAGFTYHNAKVEEISNEIIPEEETMADVIKEPIREPIEGNQPNGMLMCNAMNNAISLTEAGKVDIKDLESVYNRILNILISTKESSNQPLED